jgi:serine/threonine-protein kinase
VTVPLAGRYLVERELGHGGMATVYLAQDLTLHRRVALKVLLPELTATVGRDRFVREIAITSRLTHPNILPLHDAGEADERLFYAMPYVEGESLRQRLEREGQLPVAEALGILRDLAAALEHAHARGVIHRDIKPENILLAGGRAVIADFGIAHALDAAGGERLTATGLALGTPAYMSPEQAAGSSQPDARSDIYALGCVAYEMLAGAPPFLGPTAQAILARHAVDPVPSLHTVRPVPEAVEQAIIRALAKVPSDRFTTATEFAQALSAKTIPRSGRLHRIGWSPTLPVVLVLVVAAGAGAAWLTRKGPAPVIPRSAARLAILPVSVTTADTGLVRLGRDLAATISASLEGVGGIETADRVRVAKETADQSERSVAEAAALAQKLGAASVLHGTLVRSGDNVRLDLGLYDTESLTPLAEGLEVSGHRDSIGALTDSVNWALLRRLWQRGEPPSPSLAAVTTRSIPALRAFLDGEQALGAGRWNDARLAFLGAITADSTFWLAYFRYAMAKWWLDASVEPEVQQVLRIHQHLLPERDRLLVVAFLTSLDSMDLRLKRHREVTQRFPDYWPGWFLNGDALLHFGTERGYDWTEGLESLRRAVALEPRLAAAWVHIYDATLGKDSVELARAVSRLQELEGPLPQLDRLQVGIDQAGGVITPELRALADSDATRVAKGSVERWIQSGYFGLVILKNGFPGAQVDYNERVAKAADLSPRGRTALRAANAWAWAARGQWDSALTGLSAAASQHPGPLGPPRQPYGGQLPVGGLPLAIESYGLAVIAAWLGATTPHRAEQRRPAAVMAIDDLGDEDSRADSRGHLAWLDGILGFARGDRQAIAAARQAAVTSGYYQASLVDGSLATFERALTGERKRAGRELAALDRECLDRLATCSLLTPHIAVQRLAAAQWLGETGEIDQARRLLRWNDLESLYIPASLWTLVYVLSGPTYLARARLEESHGDARRAREYYRQFLRRYDQPMAAQQHLVEEAQAAMARLSDKEGAASR